MNDRPTPTELLVIDVVSVPGRADQLAVAEVISGEPRGQMILRSPDEPGLWRVTEFAHFQPTFSTDRERLPIGLEGIDSSSPLRAGLRLVEAVAEHANLMEPDAAIHPAALISKGETP